MRGQSIADDYRTLPVDLAQELIDRGIPQGYYDMGSLLYRGYGVKKDEAAALKYFRKAADLGNPEAQYYIGDKLTQLTIENPVPYGIGYDMKRCAAEQGHAEAAIEAAIHIKNDVRRFRNKGSYVDAVKYFHLAAKAGDSSAASTLEDAFLDPPPNDELSFLALEKDDERSRRYGVIRDILGRYSYLNPTVDEIDEIVPLPPAKLPPWDEQIKFQKEWKSNIPPPLPTEERIVEMAKAKGLNPATGRKLPPPPPPPAPKAEIPALPSPTLTGAPCPRSGRWRCLDTGQIVTITEGQALPDARYERLATGWLNRLRGIEFKFSHRGPGLWKWIDPTDRKYL
jgi:hypothetical protein